MRPDQVVAPREMPALLDVHPVLPRICCCSAGPDEVSAVTARLSWERKTLIVIFLQQRSAPNPTYGHLKVTMRK